MAEPAPPMPPLPPLVARAPGWVAPLMHQLPPTARGVPPHKWAENTPDPFLDHDPPTMAAPVTGEEVHPVPAVFMVYLLVSWLHLQFHLPFRACNAILLVFAQVVRSVGVALGGPAPLSTLTSAMSKLELEPSFTVLPVCPNCFEVYPVGSPGICTLCNTFIYKPQAANATRATKVPLLRFPFKSLESQLRGVLAVPGVEPELDKWRTAPRPAEKYTDIFDGDICKNLKAHDGHKFFQNDLGDEHGPGGELRIGVTLGVDWCVPSFINPHRGRASNYEAHQVLISA